MVEMNKKQIRSLFRKLDEIDDIGTKKDIFSHLGGACYSCRGVDKWIKTFNNDIHRMIDWISGNESPYWEKLEFGESGETLYLTGKKTESCVCEYSGSEKALESLCLYCCKRFQEILWSDLLKRKVSVEITEAVNLGGRRCSTRIYLYPDDSRQ
jgi:hypothetical protein